MVIISDCLINKKDEGGIKVASSLAKRLKDRNSAYLISYSEDDFADERVNVNRSFTNKELYRSISDKSGPIIYIPFSSNSMGGVLRTFFLSKKSKKKVYSLFVLRHPMDFVKKAILSLSGAKIIALSRESYDYYNDLFNDRVIYLKTGIDTTKFTPCSLEEKNAIRIKYGYAESDRIVLHVGHLKRGRNVDKLLNISSDYKVLVLVSSVTQKDPDLEAQLKKSENIKVIDTYIPNVEEIYKMADVYLFPVEEARNCIDVPLSVLEAAACNVPVVCTEYGELKEFRNADGFCFLKDLGSDSLNKALDKMYHLDNNNRDIVLEYDWSNAVKRLEELD
ncbi:glycosyltransferase family 4 protein [Butyrivibrio sp. VCB2001]|uniref:glycosyltransferase family 4 protein n=1 Tax=Butyrivibrio sp. VCB2001 TaxID=1280667 RepID=UPI000429C515|nr:glycosyltransferase family 4 protein [Butyrivibrio sp. VCB2001]